MLNRIVAFRPTLLTTLLLSILLTVVIGGDNSGSSLSPWGTLKPNLYFAVKEKAIAQSVVGLAWMVKDWRTDKLIVRHSYHYGDASENVQAYYTSHDGEDFARQTIVDSEYNARFLVDFLQKASSDSLSLEWQIQVKVEAIDPERSIKVVPFLYLSKDENLEAVPFGI